MINRARLSAALSAALPVLLAACDGDTGPAGPQGPAGADAIATLLTQTQLELIGSACPAGGVRIETGPDTDGDGTLDPEEIVDTSDVCAPAGDASFKRVSSFLVCSQIDATCDTDDETAAEIVAASTDGNTLIYTDSPAEVLGFVDISDPTAPLADGTVALAGEPTSVAVAGGNALVGINTSPDFVNPSGELAVIDIATRANVATLTLSGQPDSVAVSPDGSFAAIIIENERDEDLPPDGAPPQLPAGALEIVSLAGEPATWTPSVVDLTGIADLFPTDPEPEYVDINGNNVAVVTLQENNHIILVDLTDGSIVNDFSAGTVDLTQVDATEEDPAIISQTEDLPAVPREPDGVTWLNNDYFVTADEGDLDGGSRGFTIFDDTGPVWSSGNSLDHLTARLGHYPDGRSGNKGNEPENAEFGVYNGDHYLFIASERSSLIFVYDAADPTAPALKQTLPAGAGPEGVLALPSRNLLIAASEEDSRGDKIRSVLNIYVYSPGEPTYPTLESLNRPDGTPIPWSALSGLAAAPFAPDRLYAIEDSFYGSNRIFGIDTGQSPAKLDTEITITDGGGVFAAYPAVLLPDTGVAEDDPTRINVFDEVDLDLMINGDGSVNLDPEGITMASAGGFWIASEGSGTVGDPDRPVNSLNFLFKTSAAGVIESVAALPLAQNDVQLRFGFEGVAEYAGSAYVAFQRVWPGDTEVRIGVYDVVGGTWTFLFYPLDAPESQNGGWVGLSDLVSLGTGEFLVVERDNQGGPDAAIKRIYSFNVTGLAPGSTVTKTLVRDLMGDLAEPGGLTYEKIEGLAVVPTGDAFIVNDNDGVDDNSGETQLLNLGNIL